LRSLLVLPTYETDLSLSSFAFASIRTRVVRRAASAAADRKNLLARDTGSFENGAIQASQIQKCFCFPKFQGNLGELTPFFDQRTRDIFFDLVAARADGGT